MSLRPSQLRRRFCSCSCAAKGKGYSGGGGYREGSGRGKSGYYQGVFCNSSWELAWVLYQVDHGIAFRRNTEGFPYIFEGETHLYYPDFVMDDGTYLEVKGYSSPQWRAKCSQFPHPLRVLTKVEMQPILRYVKDTYGTDFIRLYGHERPPVPKPHLCVVCGSPCKRKACSRVCSGRLVATLRGWDKQSRPSGESAISPLLQSGVLGAAPG